MKIFSCIIFDLDGTLTQTNELIFATFNHVSEKYCQRKYSSSEITAMFGPPEEVAIENLVGRDRLEIAMDDFYSFYESYHPRLASAYGGIREVLEFLKSKRMILAIFTGKGKRTAMMTLEKIGIEKFFDLIVTGNDVDSYKPSAEGIRKVLNTFKLEPSDVLMVGDSVSDVQAANEAGVPIAAVLWDSYSKEKVLQMEVDYRFHSVEDFAKWLQAILPANGGHLD